MKWLVKVEIGYIIENSSPVSAQHAVANNDFRLKDADGNLLPHVEISYIDTDFDVDCVDDDDDEEGE